MIDAEELHRIHKVLKSCLPLFFALGDEARQKLILDIADAGNDGINVTKLAEKSKLSRPAISHHLKVLKDCELIQPKKVGTQIFYQLTLNKNLNSLSDFINSISNVLENITPPPQEEE